MEQVRSAELALGPRGWRYAIQEIPDAMACGYLNHILPPHTEGSGAREAFESFLREHWDVDGSLHWITDGKDSWRIEIERGPVLVVGQA